MQDTLMTGALTFEHLNKWYVGLDASTALQLRH